MESIKLELVRYLLVESKLTSNGQTLINEDNNVIYTRRKPKRYTNLF